MTRNEPSTTNRPSKQSVATVILPLGIAVGWVGAEFGLRRGVVPHLAAPLGGPFVADWTVLLVGAPVMAGCLSWLAVQGGLSPGNWGYDWSGRAVVLGVVGAVVSLGLTAGTAAIDSALFGGAGANAAFADAVTETVQATPMLAALFLLGNGVVAPIAEELVWRGIVQTRLVEIWGPVVGIGTTAVGFALKHVVVDGSLARLTTLLVLGTVFGLLRYRYGTVSSTVAHVGVNTVSTAALVVVAVT